MSLKEMDYNEISVILKEKKRKFNSYRVDSSSLSEEKEIISKEMPNVKDLNEAPVPVAEKNESIDVIEKVIDIKPKKRALEEHKFENNANDGSKSYNERMKGGFFGKRRRR